MPEVPVPQPQQPQQEQTTKQQLPCPGDCKSCPPNQHAYCAVQMGWTTMALVSELISRVSLLQESTERLSEKVEAQQQGLQFEAPKPEKKPSRKK